MNQKNHGIDKPPDQKKDRARRTYVGTIIGESTTQEFRLAVAEGSLKEQDIIAVDSENEGRDGTQPIRIWAKVQQIERLNPLFPQEAGHELAATQTNPFDTVLSLSREMVSAVCRVLGAETEASGRLEKLRYPAKPATMAYRPEGDDVARIVAGDLDIKRHRALDIATLATREEIDVLVDGHAIVSRHLAVLAMTGAGKSFTARRIVEELAKKNYPIVIFDPHGDYTGLADVPSLRNRVSRYYASFPIFEEDAETVARIVNDLGYGLTPKMETLFSYLFNAAKNFIDIEDPTEKKEKVKWLAETLSKPEIMHYGVRPDLWLVADLAEVGESVLRKLAEVGESVLRKKAEQSKSTLIEDLGWADFKNYTAKDAETLKGIKTRTRRAAAVLRRMEKTNRQVAEGAAPLPVNRSELVDYGRISVISLAGYTSDFQATIYSLVADSIFEARVKKELTLPVLFLLEEAHNFAPAQAATEAEKRSVAITRQIAQEGRKFGVGLILISQRPSRLDETTLSQCNSFVIMRMVNPADQNFVRRAVESLGEGEAKMLPDLDVGEALLSGQIVNFPVLAKIKAPASRGEREEEDAFQELERAHQELERTHAQSMPDRRETPIGSKNRSPKTTRR